ncbi:MAG: ABC transporter substrate-binding protein [Paraclostridium sp.]
MKRKIIGLLVTVLCTSSFIMGCSNTSQTKEEEIKETIEVNVVMPDGLPAVSVAKLVKENPIVKEGYNITYTVENTPDSLSTTVMKQGAEIAIVPSNMAAIAYNKTSNYQIGATTGLGSFYLVSTEDISGFEDLKGKEVGNTGKGLTPDITVQSVLKEKGINPAEINFTYVNAANELVPLVATGKINTAIVPEPALSALMSQNPNVKIIKSLNEEYKEVTGSEFGYPQATIIIKSDFAKKNTEFVKEFLNNVKESVNFANENSTEVGAFSEAIGVTTKKEMITKSIEKANLQYIGIKDSTKEYQDYYKRLADFDVKTLGGKLPDEGIFLEK